MAFVCYPNCSAISSTIRMTSREDWTFHEWLSAYVDKYHRRPESANHLCAFARNQGGHVMFRMAQEKLKEPPKDNTDVNEAPTLQRSRSWAHDGLEAKLRAPVLQRFRSEKIMGDVFIKEVPGMMRGMPSSSDPEHLATQKSFRNTNTEPLQSSAKLAAAVLACCYRKVGEREARKSMNTIAQFGLNNNHYLDESNCTERCAICLEVTQCLQSAAGLCRERQCRGWFCAPCLEKHVTTVIEDTRFSVPHIRCPSCFGFVPPSCWQRFSKDELRSQWNNNAADLLSIRCGDCDEPGTLLQPREEADESARQKLARSLLGEGSADVACALVEKWYLFEKGAMSAPDLVAALLDLWGAGRDEVSETEGTPSFAAEFATAMRLVEDAGLRAVLQLAMLKRFPKTQTSCCDTEHCFRCKVHTHHEGTTCEEILAEQMPETGVQFCPSCNVATVRTEGCNHIICLCGENWTWEGDEE